MSAHSPIDYELMIRLWLNGSPQSRDVALDMADRDREAAARTKRITVTGEAA